MTTRLDRSRFDEPAEIFTSDPQPEAVTIINLLELWHGGVGEPLALGSYYEPVNVTSYEWDDLGGTPVARDYLPFGFDIGGLSCSMGQTTPTLGVRIALSGDLLTVLSATDIRGLLLVLKSYELGTALDDPDNITLFFIGKIEEWSELDRVVTLSVKDSTINYWLKNPKRQYSYQCGHAFKREKCAYAGATTYCDKTLTTCTLLGNEAHFGGFKNVWRQMRSIL